MYVDVELNIWNVVCIRHECSLMYGVECTCRGLHTLVMGLRAVAQIALH